MRIRLRGTRKSGGELCKIDRFDFEQSDDQARKTFDPSEIPAKMKFEDIGEHGSMIPRCDLLERKSLWEKFLEFPR